VDVDSDRLSRARIRPARTAEDVERATEFLKTPRVREIFEGHPEERGAVRLCEVDDELVGALLLDPSPLRLRGVEVRCARLLETGGEDGRRCFRETGDRDLFVLLLEEALGYVWIKRYPLVYVHGELALYPAHGFVPCFFHPRVHVPTAAALTLEPAGRVRRFKADDVRAIQRLRRADPDEKPQVLSMGVPAFHHFAVEGPDRSVRGCLAMQVKPESNWKPKLFAPEVDVADRGAARTVLRHCAEEAARIGLDEFHFALGPGHPLARLCLEIGGRYELRGVSAHPLHDEEMIHVVDPSELVNALGPFFERQLARAHAHETVAEIPLSTGSGAWMLRVDGGRVVLDALERRAEGCIELPEWKFVQLLAGYRAVSELDAPLTAEQEDVLSMLLPKTWPYSLPDPDIWGAGDPPQPYTPAAAEVVARTVRPWAPGFPGGGANPAPASGRS